MDWGNQSEWVGFVFLAYPSCPELRVLSFLAISLVYALIITGNVLILASVRAEVRLHTPMYYFLGSLSGVEICYTAAVAPHMLVNTLRSDHRIPLLGCATQMTFFIGLGSADCLLLAAMAYDRYVAICHPLQYPLVMTLTLCVRLVLASGLLGFSLSLQLVAFIFSLPFCRARGIEHFFCDVPPVMQLVCASGAYHEQSVLAAAMVAIAVPLVLITASYARILAAVLGVPSAAGRGRAFSTCSSHLTVVLLQYGCCTFMYLRPSHSYQAGRDELISLLYTLGTPLLNPLIYTLRNSEMKGAVGKVVSRSCVAHSPGGHHRAGWGLGAATAHLHAARDALS